MKIAKLVARLLCTTGILIAGVYTAAAVGVVFFIATGTLIPGGIMFFDLPTPALLQTLMFIGAGSIIVGGLAFARHKLSLDSQK